MSLVPTPLLRLETSLLIPSLSASGSGHQGQPMGWEDAEAGERALPAGHIPGEAAEEKCGALLPPRS